jgi:taurine dioxygenase
MSVISDTITVTPLSPVIGAEIGGVDLSRPLSARTLAAIKDAFHANLVILFRGQKLTDEDQTRFAQGFGEVEIVKSSISQRESQPHIMFISNVRDAGLRTALEDGEMWFHSDQCYYERPVCATTLYAIEVPKTGGNTLFANGYLAYETLPAELKAKLDGRGALNIYDYQYNPVVKARVNRPEAPRYVHPAVRTHPETGRKALYVNRLMTERIEGLAPEESSAVLARVFEHLEKREFVYEHVWRPGDLIMWDNRCSTHARTHFEPTERRMLRRITIKGDKPF